MNTLKCPNSIAIIKSYYSVIVVLFFDHNLGICCWDKTTSTTINYTSIHPIQHWAKYHCFLAALRCRKVIDQDKKDHQKNPHQGCKNGRGGEVRFSRAETTLSCCCFPLGKNKTWRGFIGNQEKAIMCPEFIMVLLLVLL